ncbi:laminin subunit beta-4 [Hyperolius riggenbachi]|uniref:laminin subunit beta-4 n=1 Tax=Hyperolius riggenbachi TaxID=752182 RepID=UPI0035A2F473
MAKTKELSEDLRQRIVAAHKLGNVFKYQWLQCKVLLKNTRCSVLWKISVDVMEAKSDTCAGQEHANGPGNPITVNGTMNKEQYMRIFNENIKQSAEKLGLGHQWTFQHANDPKHTAKVVKKCLNHHSHGTLQEVSVRDQVADGAFTATHQDEQKCFTCDSRYPYDAYTNTNSHQIENVISTFDPDWKKKWWQSENGVDLVSIRLDLETLFQFSHLVMTFKTFRPAAMLVERSRDLGRTWKVIKYFAQDCESAFPDIPQGHGNDIGEVICDSRYSDLEPSTEGEVVLKTLDPSFDIDDPYDPYIQDIITLTNLRINFTKLHTFGDTRGNGWHSEPQEKYYYALYEIIVRGNCFCNGHASQCVPVNNMRGDVFSEPGMVHGKCVCQHNTDGLNCEKCKEFYNDAPWRPAVGFEDNACKKCNCNGHSDKCHFDMNVYQANNGTSGGVCEDCQHNTVGNQCEFCKTFFYRDPLRDISDPDTCIPCDCDRDGTFGGGLCEGHTNRRLGIIAGTCLCKQHVEGIRCDQCKPGYFGLSATYILGCKYCGCNPFGSLPSSVCDAISGQCQCQNFATGQYCDECIPGYWGLGNSLHACSACDCDIGGAHSSECSQSTGQCNCLPNIVGRQCNKPADGYYFVSIDYYIYEAESAQALSGSATIVDPTPMPKCKDYFMKQGIDFRFENNRIILKSMPKRSIRGRRQAQEIIPFGTAGVVELVLREPTPGKPVTWTGPGFARVSNGAGLRFTVNNIPYSMDFIIAIRYEPESLNDWAARIMINIPHGEASERCKNNSPLPEGYTLLLAATSRIALLNASVCLDQGREYLIDVYFSQISNVNTDKVYILVDSLGLIPQISSISNLCSDEDLQAYDYYNCIEIASDIGAHILPDVCERLLISMSARIHNGAVKCTCNSKGSVSNRCSEIGGRCQCKPNVVGSCCDKCAIGSYGFGPSGCLGCDCHSSGSISTLCDQVTGQCACRKDIQGRRCDSCLPGYYGFPNCRPCPCSGRSKTCDPVTGACEDCEGFSTGTNCEICLENYYGNPLLGQPCQPCMCPDSPTSNQYNAHSCQQDPITLEVTCNCLEGYTGKKCNECPAGFYGNLEEGEECSPCQCNDNMDVTDPGSCDTLTGECLKCLNNAYGPKCELCLPGYFGSGRHRNCTKCDCDVDGSINSLCDQVTGQCTCRSDIQGHRCDSCLPGYYKFPKCKPCQCNGNSETCDPVTGACKDCKGFSTGANCEKCIKNYYGNPLLGQPCRPCMCPGSPTSNQYFAQSCQQDPNTLKVTCNCLDGYTGKNCDECPTGFYGNVDEGEECSPCQCNNNVDVKDPGVCDKVTGECLKCLNNTYGPKCELCMPGYFGSGRHQNCTSCVCNPEGTNAENCSIYEEVGECVCDRTTGQCPCLPNVVGISCDKCKLGYWGFSTGKGCQPCNCYLNNSYGKECNQITGQCLCKPRYKGKKCDQCAENHYGNAKVQCLPCSCSLEGTQKPVCDKDTGACICKAGVIGRNCDQCAPKFKQEFPACPRCHVCFDQYDAEVTSLSDSAHGLVRLAANIGPTSSTTGCDIQISILQDKLSTIEKMFRSPLLSPDKYKKVKNFYDIVRQKLGKIKIPDLGRFNEIPKLNKTIWDMEKEIDDLYKDLNTIKERKQKEKTVKVTDIQASFDKITKHYKTFLSAAEKARNAKLVIQVASKNKKSRVTALSLLDVKDKQSLDKLNKMKSLQISKMNEMICGTVWDFPCDVSPCGGALCRDKFGRRKCGGPDCNGAVPLARDGLKKANETDTRLKGVAIHLLEAEKQIQSIRQLAEDTKLKASRLTKTLSKAMSRVEADKNRSKELIKIVKEFLLDSIPVYQCRSKTGGRPPKKPLQVDATPNPEEIEKIANEILAIKLPAAPYDLINTLNRIKKMCDEYNQNKKNLQKQLEDVKKLTQQAKDAKKAVDNLPSGDEIRNNLKQAENAQKKTSSVLKNLNKNIQDIRNRLSQAKDKADMTDNRYKAIKDLHTELEAKISALQEKMLQNRKAAAKAEKSAQAALKEAAENENSLSDLKEKYELLKEKMKKREIPEEILQRLEKLKNDAEDFAREIDAKFDHIADLEERIDDLNKLNEEKAKQLLDLEQHARELKDYILVEGNRQTTCKE